MKTTLMILFLLCAVTAFGQSAPVLSNVPGVTTFYENPQHAAPHSLAQEHPLVGGMSDAYGYGQGEQPLWEFGPVSEPVPLGDVARAYRREKVAAKKATLVLDKQGS